MPSEMMNCFIDTNIMIYAMDPKEPKKRAVVSDLIKRIDRNHRLVISPQSLNECYRVLSRTKTDEARQSARSLLTGWSLYCDAPMTSGTTFLAWQVEKETGYQWWDCLLLASAIQAHCDVFISEDMQHGRRVHDLRIINPFVVDPLITVFT
jgi:predicted nucleic acid-binding protein